MFFWPLKKEIYPKPHKGFTLIELLITVAIIAVLMTVIVIAINPVEYLRKARDIKRISDFTNLQMALQLVASDKTISMGICDGTKIYASVPSETPLSNDNLPSGVSWVQVSQTNLMKTNGTGWIPIDFSGFASKGILLPAVPIDPKNSVSDYLFYTYTCNSNRQFILTAWFESQAFGPKGQDPKSKSDGGPDPYLYEVGSNLFISPLRPVGNWGFDEGSGNIVYDLSGNGNNGTLYNGPTWTTGKIGSALSFDGSNDYVVTNNFDLSNTNKITVSMWLKFSGSTAQIPLEHSTNFNSNNAFMVDHSEYGGAGSLQFGDHNSSGYNIAYSTTGYNNNQWHHFVAVSDRGLDGLNQITLYVDGNQNTIHHATYRVDLNGNYGNYPLYFGSRGGSSVFFNGSIDDVRIYNRVLSTAEINRHYQLVK